MNGLIQASVTPPPRATRSLGRARWCALLSVLVGLMALLATPALALDVYLNGMKVQNLKNVDLVNCSVKFDANGDIQILSPGYRIEYGTDGQQKVVGQSDMASAKPSSARPKMRYVLVYEPNPKVNVNFEVWLNNKLFRRIGLDAGRFTVEMTQDLTPGQNTLRVIAKTGDAIPGGLETDVTSLRVFRGDATADGAFRARSPAVWEMVRSAIDRQPLDRSVPLSIE